MMKFENIHNIIIFRALQLGDMLCAIPAIRALRNAFPDARIVLAGLPWAQTLTQRFPHYFDSFFAFPGYPGLPEQIPDPAAFTDFLKRVQNEKFDLAIQMQGNGSVVNPMVELFGARYTAGFCVPDHYFPDNGLFMPYPDAGSEISRHVRLMYFLGIPSAGLNLEFPLAEPDYQEFNKLNLPTESGRYVCIHPGSRGAWRQWPVAYFAALADYCAEQGFSPVITGTTDELPIVDEVASLMKTDPVIAAGKTSLGVVGVLIKNAHLLISNCTGVSHMASAFRTPSIVISMDGEPGRWAPLDRERHRVIDWTMQPDFHAVFSETKKLVGTGMILN